MHKPREPSITAVSYHSVADIQTQLNFEIPYGQQNSSTTETDLIQRSLASKA